MKFAPKSVPQSQPMAAFNKLVGVHIKAYLLAVIVAVIGENSAVAVHYKPD